MSQDKKKGKKFEITEEEQQEQEEEQESFQ